MTAGVGGCTAPRAGSVGTHPVRLGDRFLREPCASGGTADALASGASVRKGVGVQIPPRAHTRTGPRQHCCRGSFVPGARCWCVHRRCGDLRRRSLSDRRSPPSRTHQDRAPTALLSGLVRAVGARPSHGSYRGRHGSPHAYERLLRRGSGPGPPGIPGDHARCPDADLPRLRRGRGLLGAGRARGVAPGVVSSRGLQGVSSDETRTCTRRSGSRRSNGQPRATASSFGGASSFFDAVTSPVVRSTACTVLAAGSVT